MGNDLGCARADPVVRVRFAIKGGRGVTVLPMPKGQASAPRSIELTEQSKQRRNS